MPHSVCINSEIFETVNSSSDNAISFTTGCSTASECRYVYLIYFIMFQHGSSNRTTKSSIGVLFRYTRRSIIEGKTPCVCDRLLYSTLIQTNSSRQVTLTLNQATLGIEMTYQSRMVNPVVVSWMKSKPLTGWYHILLYTLTWTNHNHTLSFG